ncbi:hypothetical protein AK88_05308 [Plasmodium fragile]|uniref:Uncharacterized protein n=1 Tax=Plasmodium fragile TaxID=5857 RepID=A0A0D9QDF1_PLAFR|nr:uncharacterized protein AK88_05308 [Plasmodium fragile]KJP85053.1 hypothetical protein AK88_05308 [Plasmodium fragile]
MAITNHGITCTFLTLPSSFLILAPGPEGKVHESPPTPTATTAPGEAQPDKDSLPKSPDVSPPAPDSRSPSSGASGATGAPGNSGGGAVAAGSGNDDPPPLNPPKPKPEPTNPDQSGSSPGGTGAGGLPDGAGGGAGRGGGGGSGSSPSSTTSRATASNGDDKENNAADSKMQAENVGFELDLKPYKGGLDGSYAPPSPEVTASDKPVTIPGRSKDDDAISPIFTAKDIFLSSPILIFVASVTSLIVLYSLWKRTIMELHLEVLNECEAPEWENVKDDYLQIVVEDFAQEFAQDMIRDDNRNNNILDVPNSHAALATHDSTTLDSCRPKEEDPDPWSCMETIQFKEEGTPAPFPENVNSRVVCRRSYMWIHYYRICEMRMGST